MLEWGQEWSYYLSNSPSTARICGNRPYKLPAADLHQLGCTRRQNENIKNSMLRPHLCASEVNMRKNCTTPAIVSKW